jgi:hypothetical protein
MKIKFYPSIPFLKIFLVIIMLFSNYSMIYGQDMEDAIVSLSFSEENDTKTLIATATDQNGLPIEDLELYFYVKRTFSLLPIGDPFNSTDENGMVELEFPNDLPGDHEGNVVIIVKIMESDMYNDLSIESSKNWGIPTALDQLEEKRSLWAAAANAPITLILIVSVLIIAIWFIICYIIFKLYIISKIKPLKDY